MCEFNFFENMPTVATFEKSILPSLVKFVVRIIITESPSTEHSPEMGFWMILERGGMGLEFGNAHGLILSPFNSHSRHAFAHAAFVQKIFAKAFQLPVKQVVILFNKANSNIGNGFRWTNFYQWHVK
jgi:hypothetical protein